MAEPDISPLAKSLAEQNAIDWRLLPGSGPGGRVTERDVFVYLAEQHARQDAGSQAFDEELILVADDAEPFDVDPVGVELHHARAEEEEAATEAALILDLGAEDEAAPAQEAASAELDWSAMRFDDHLEDAAFHEQGANEQGEVEGQAVEGQAVEGQDGDAFDFSAYGADAASPDATRPEDIDAWDLDAAASGTGDSDAGEPPPDRLDIGNLEIGGLDLDRLDIDRLEVSHPDADVTEVSGAGTEAHGGGERPDAAEAGDLDDLAFKQLELGGSSPLDGADAPPAQEPDSPGPAGLSTNFPADTTTPGVAPPGAAPFSPEALPRMEHGLLLRNHLGLAPLLEVQKAAEQALAGEARAVRAALLLRAAARALERETGEAQVALAVFAEKRVVSVRIAEAARLPFGELVECAASALAARDGHDEAALLVADLSAYGVDEAILRVGTPSLMLGRVEEGETARGALSLAGELEPTRAAALLAHVSDQLEAPIALLL